MREIKFRGKRIDKNEWIYGSLVWNSSVCLMFRNLDPKTYDVLPKTVGQYTGLKDKEGNEVYDGDIYRNHENGLIGVLRIETTIGGDQVYCKEKKDGDIFNYRAFSELDLTDFTLLGNIHDNPDLL